jgi:Amt family ammonium transporter
MKRFVSLATASLFALPPTLALADEAAGPTPAELGVVADTVWVLVCAFLVFFMHAGFALLESGFCRKKNVVNILGKNMMVVAVTAVVFYLAGFALMFGNGNTLIGTSGFLVPNDASLFESLSWTTVPVSAKFIFQMVFAATAATIVSGAVAERIH